MVPLIWNTETVLPLPLLAKSRPWHTAMLSMSAVKPPLPPVANGEPATALSAPVPRLTA